LNNPWKRLASRVVYENPWISLREDRVVRPDGNEGIYGVIDTRVATGVVALTPELDVYLVGQFRYTMDQYSWEIVEGGGEHDEDPMDAAKRELQEEAGLIADFWEPLGGELHLNNGYSSEKGFLYLATGLHAVEAAPEVTEDLQLIRIPFAEALARVLVGEITDGLTIIALLLLERRLRAEGKMPPLPDVSTLAPLPVHPNPWQRLDTQPKYTNPWIKVREDSVLRPDGQPGIYGVVSGPENVNIAAFDAQDHLILVGQYRYTTDYYSWELVGGGGDVTQSPLSIARRELEEETGIQASDWTALAMRLQLTNCHATERSHLLVARNLAEGTPHPDATEDLAYRRLPLSEALALVLQNEIRDCLSIIGILWLSR